MKVGCFFTIVFIVKLNIIIHKRAEKGVMDKCCNYRELCMEDTA